MKDIVSTSLEHLIRLPTEEASGLARLRLLALPEPLSALSSNIRSNSN